MNDAPKTATTAGDGPLRGTRRRMLLVAAALVVAAAVALTVILTGGGEPADGSAAASSSPTEGPAPTESAAPTSASAAPFTPADPTAPPVPADELPAVLPAVALTETVVVEKIRGSLVSVDAIEARAEGRGNIGGPALRVTVRLENGTDDAASLGEVSVNLRLGAERTPASPVEDPSQRLFQGMLAPGDTAEGVYVFRVPVEARDGVAIEVGYRAGAPIAVFTGTPG